ncbi:unknown protein [Seminavis robusta]|uniref:Uncharacterized protein n=1 Tax=Seminavis robusta TaxID=568900 RepID=A0A9N8HGB5_9STRA|nr:unknown protein [Seminavis robusta]|eukprot:Sro568_g168111.1  (142) ;mRNA; f:11026-11451
MQYLLSEDAKIFLIDCPRSRKDIHIPYDLLEGIKDGDILSTKYVPINKYIHRPNTVVVFMNECPDSSKLSLDRFVAWLRRKIGWAHATPDEEGTWTMPPPEGDTESKTIQRINQSQAKESRKYKSEVIQEAHRKLQYQLAL